VLNRYPKIGRRGMVWYVRDKKTVSGPFPAGQVQQAILLGRVRLDAEVSLDKQIWTPLRQVQELIPEVLQGDVDDEHMRERLAAARRWADERRRERRAGDEDPERQGPGRRAREPYATLEYRDRRENVAKTLKPSRERVLAVIVFVGILLGGGIYAGFHWIPQQPNTVNCQAPPVAGVNWRLCNKTGVQILNANLVAAELNSTNFQGASLFGSNLRDVDADYANFSSTNLSFVEFQGAKLKGASLRSSDIRKANFSGADLSYADLRDAKIADTVFARSNLSNALWVDGRKCLPGSIGECRFAN